MNYNIKNTGIDLTRVNNVSKKIIPELNRFNYMHTSLDSNNMYNLFYGEEKIDDKHIISINLESLEYDFSNYKDLYDYVIDKIKDEDFFIISAFEYLDKKYNDFGNNYYFNNKCRSVFFFQHLRDL